VQQISTKLTILTGPRNQIYSGPAIEYLDNAFVQVSMVKYFSGNEHDFNLFRSIMNIYEKIDVVEWLTNHVDNAFSFPTYIFSCILLTHSSFIHNVSQHSILFFEHDKCIFTALFLLCESVSSTVLSNCLLQQCLATTINGRKK
jgi:hypothetical protein